jgi:hypothetical protein
MELHEKSTPTMTIHRWVPLSDTYRRSSDLELGSSTLPSPTKSEEGRFSLLRFDRDGLFLT